MSFESPQQSASAEAARGQATRSSQLADVSLPQLSSILSRVQGDLSANQIAPSVQQAFGAARTGINQDFAAANKGEQAYIPQAFAQAGGIYNTNQMADAKLTAAQNLDFERRQAMKRLDFQEAEAGLTQYNSLLNLLGSGVGTGLNLAGGFSGTQSQAIGGAIQPEYGLGGLERGYGRRGDRGDLRTLWGLDRGAGGRRSGLRRSAGMSKMFWPKIRGAKPRSRWFRFWEKVHIPEKGCWEWQAATTRGYGSFSWRRGAPKRAHRVAYEFLKGPIPQGLTLDHLCRNHSCVNPDHLEAVTAVENIMRGNGVGVRGKAKTHCLRGHPFSPENTIYYEPGRRTCQTCKRIVNRRSKAKRREARHFQSAG